MRAFSSRQEHLERPPGALATVSRSHGVQARAHPWRTPKTCFTGLGLGLGIALFAVLIMIFASYPRIDWEAQPFLHHHYIVGIVLLGLAAYVLLYGAKDPSWDALSPFRLFYLVWFTTLGLSWLQLASVNQPFTLKMWLVLVLGLGGFWLGGRLEQARVASIPRPSLEALRKAWSLNWSRSRALFAITALFALCLGALIYEYKTLGFLPLTSEDPAWGKANFSANPFIQRFTVSFYILLAFAYFGYAFLKHLKTWYLSLMLISFAVMTLLSARSQLLIGLVTVVVFYHFCKKALSPKLMVLLLLVGYPASKLAVDVGRYYAAQTREGYEDMLYGMGFPKQLYVFAPDYLYVTGTMISLQELLDVVPDERAFFHGYYMSYPVRAFLMSGGKRKPSETRIPELLWDRTVRKYGFPWVVPSFLGEPYADFGMPGVFLLALCFGWFSVWAYERMRRKPAFWNVFLYSQLAFAIVSSFYSGAFVLMEFYWCLGLGCSIHLIAREGRGSIRHSASAAARLPFRLLNQFSGTSK